MDKDIKSYLPLQAASGEGWVKEGDYKDENGIWHCGVCGRAKQKKMILYILLYGAYVIAA